MKAIKIIQGGLCFQPSLNTINWNEIEMLSNTTSSSIENINDFGFTHTRANHTSHHLLNLRIGYPSNLGTSTAVNRVDPRHTGSTLKPTGSSLRKQFRFRIFQ